MEKYDYLVVGSGLFGSVFAKESAKRGKKILLLEKRLNIGGNVSTELVHGVRVHLYGPHIFHTSNRKVWNYVTDLAEFWPYQHKVKAFYKGKIYSLPFNMQTYYDIWGVTNPEEAQREIDRQKVPIKSPRNLEEWSLAHIGRDLYQTLIYGYTKKQWMRDPKELPASIICRLPIRMTYDDNYYKHYYQGIPVKGYSYLIERILEEPGIEIKTGEDFFDLKDWKSIAKKLVYSGSIDQFFNYEFGYLEYRGLQFEHEVVPLNYQGVAQMNYTDESVPYTRIVEHNHFAKNPVFGQNSKSIITYEYPVEWKPGLERYYPINDEKNLSLYTKYKKKSKQNPDVIFGGRLGTYKYLDMDDTIAQAFTLVEREFNSEV